MCVGAEVTNYYNQSIETPREHDKYLIHHSKKYIFHELAKGKVIRFCFLYHSIIPLSLGRSISITG